MGLQDANLEHNIDLRVSHRYSQSLSVCYSGRDLDVHQLSSSDSALSRALSAGSGDDPTLTVAVATSLSHVKESSVDGLLQGTNGENYTMCTQIMLGFTHTRTTIYLRNFFLQIT